jgi:hypothetical protein
VGLGTVTGPLELARPGEALIGEGGLQPLRLRSHPFLARVEGLAVLQARGVLHEGEVRRAAQIGHRAEHHEWQRQQARPAGTLLELAVRAAHIHGFPNEQLLQL